MADRVIRVKNGMVVSEVCAANDMAYYYGPCTITYVACCMLY